MQDLTRNPNHLVRSFDSVEEMLSLRCAPVNRDRHGKTGTDAGIQRWGSSHIGISTRREYDALLRGGWPEGVRKLHETLGKTEMDLALQRRRRVRRRGDFGDDLDIQAVYRGDLDRAWERSEHEERADGRAPVTLVVDIAASAGRNADEFFWRGAAALSLADGFQASGRPVKIIAVVQIAGLFDDGGTGSVTFPVKDFGEPLDPDRLAFLLCHPAFFRITGFLSLLSMSKDRTVTYGIGYPSPQKNPGLFGIEGECVWVDGCYSEDQARATIERVKKEHEPATAGEVV